MCRLSSTYIERLYRNHQHKGDTVTPDIDRLQMARLARGWTYRKLAAASRLNYHTCVATLHGRTQSPSVIAAMARALRVPVAEVWR